MFEQAKPWTFCITGGKKKKKMTVQPARLSSSYVTVENSKGPNHQLITVFLT